MRKPFIYMTHHISNYESLINDIIEQGSCYRYVNDIDIFLVLNSLLNLYSIHNLYITHF